MSIIKKNEGDSMNAVSFQNGAQWVTLSSFIGLILPVLIEKFAGGIKGKSKIVVVVICCLLTSIVQVGLAGKFEHNGTGYFASAFIAILLVSINSWNSMWKKWFPKEPSPITVPVFNVAQLGPKKWTKEEQKKRKWVERQTAYTHYNNW